MLKIKRAAKSGQGKKLGLKKGDVITAFDGFKAIDELDYLYYDSKESFLLTVKTDGGEKELAVKKEPWQSLGLEIEKDQTIKTCCNKCMFCFIDQMPRGMRESLYLKDDDVKYSFICGNFVTLTNLSAEDIDRIIRLKLSPLYISVHATDVDTRVRLTGNRFAGKILEYIERLAKGGIEMHTQAVIVKGINDGEVLKKMARDLFGFYPFVKTLAVVPCGLTKHRENLEKIQPFSSEQSLEIIQTADMLNSEFKENFVMCSDEFYFDALTAVPSAEFYGEFPQIENGVGMAAKFDLDFEYALKEVALKRQKNLLLVTGTAAYEFIKNKAKTAEKHIKNLKTEVICCKNSFFGESVTCAGLITGGDIIKALDGIDTKKFDALVLPSNMLKEFESVFLDGLTVKRLSRMLKLKIRIAAGGDGFFNALI